MGGVGAVGYWIHRGKHFRFLPIWQILSVLKSDQKLSTGISNVEIQKWHRAIHISTRDL